MMEDRKFDVMVERKSAGCGLETVMKATSGGQWNPAAAAAAGERVIGDVIGDVATLQRQNSRRAKTRKRTLNDSDSKLNGADEKRRRFNSQTTTTTTTSESSPFASPTVTETVSQPKMVPLPSPGYLDAVALFWWRQQLISRCMYQFPATDFPAPLHLLPPPISTLPPLPPVGTTSIPSFPSSTAFQVTSLRPTYIGNSDVTGSSAGANSGYVTQTKTTSDGRDDSAPTGRLQPFDSRHPTPTGCPSPTTVTAHAPNDVIATTAAACPRVLHADRKLDCCSATKRPRSDFSIPSILAGGRFGSARSTVSSSSGVDSDVTTDVDECRSSLSGTSASGFYDDRSRSSTSRSSTIDADADDRLSGPMLLLTTLQQQHPSAVMTQSSACFRCAECGAPYATSSGLNRHQKLQCAGHQRQLAPAAVATIDVSSSSSSSSTCRRFDCPQCEKVYSSLGALKMHIRTHTLPCRCPVCSKSFSRPWLLQGHLRTHTGERPFSCVLCQRAFADRSNLRAHEQTHSAVKRYRCGSCSRAFSRASLLSKHREAGVCGSGIGR